MKKLIKVTLILGLLISIASCNNGTRNNQKEKELLEKEVELLKKEKELLEKSEINSNSNKENNAQHKKETLYEVKKTNNEFLISNGKVGIFEIGKKLPTYSKYQIIKKTETIYADYNDEPDEIGTEQIYYSVSKEENQLLKCYITKELISGILVFSDKFETSKKIGVNSTVEQFIKAYPDYKIDDDGTFGFKTKDINALFRLDMRDYIGDIEQPIETNTDLDINSKIKYTNIKFKKNSKILSISIY